MQQQNIDIHSAITALSCSLDLVGVDEVRHGKRVAISRFVHGRRLEMIDRNKARAEKKRIERPLIRVPL